MRLRLVALVLFALVQVAAVAPLGMGVPVMVPGTDQEDLLAHAEREWRFDGKQGNQVDHIGVPRDPQLLWLAVRVHGERGILETAATTTRDEGQRFDPVFNVGVVASSLRFDPPLALPDGAGVETVHPERLAWETPRLENESRNGHAVRIMTTQAALVHPQENTTSPPVGWTQNESALGPETGWSLTWRIEMHERPKGEEAGQAGSPAAIRFSWNLTGEHDDGLQADQEILMRFRYDYEAFRMVVRPATPEDGHDGAYLLDPPHRAALRLGPLLTPLLGEDHTPGIPRQATIDAYGGVDGRSITTVTAGTPPPVIVESRAVLGSDEQVRGVSLRGDLVFMTAAREVNDAPPEGPPQPLVGYPVAPAPWAPLFVVAVALLMLVPRGPR